MLLCGTNVQSSTGVITHNTTIEENVSMDNLIFYDYIGFSELIVTDIILDRTYDIDLTMNYTTFGKYQIPFGFGSNDYDLELWGVKPNLFYIQNPNVTGDTQYSRVYLDGSRVFQFPVPNDYVGTEFDYYYHFKSDLNDEGVYITTVSYWATYLSNLEDGQPVELGTFTNNLVNTEHQLVFNLYGDASQMRFINFNAIGSDSYLLYPASNIDKTKAGFYDVANKKFYSVTNFTLGNVTISPEIPNTPDTSQPSNDKDYTENFNNLQNSVDNLNQTQQETNDFLKDDTVDDSNFELPTVEVSDPTANFFDTLFTGLYGAFTSTGNKTISFKVINTDITINSSDFKFLIADEFTLLRYLLSTTWVVGIGMFILKDIRSMIEKIKNGDIEGIAKGDIKADMV